MTTNYNWKETVLQPNELPAKVQRFIEMMGIDTSRLTLMILTPSPDGDFIKSFDKGESRKIYSSCAAIAEFNAVYFFLIP